MGEPYFIIRRIKLIGKRQGKVELHSLPRTIIVIKNAVIPIVIVRCGSLNLPLNAILVIFNVLATPEPALASRIELGLGIDAGLHTESVETLGLHEVQDIELYLLS